MRNYKKFQVIINKGTLIILDRYFFLIKTRNTSVRNGILIALRIFEFKFTTYYLRCKVYDFFLLWVTLTFAAVNKAESS